MEIKAELNNLRIAPRKSREVVDLIRGKDVVRAKTILEFTVRRAAEPVLKLLNSAVASAFHNFQLKDSDLYVSKITVDGGPTLKRFFPMSRGRAYPIMKRTSHITLVLSDKRQATINKRQNITESNKEKPNFTKAVKKKISGKEQEIKKSVI